MPRTSRQTKQKQAIHETVKKMHKTFTASQLAQVVQSIDSSISRATTYRYLANARKTGELHSFHCGSERIYSLEQKNHCHFMCEECSSVQHITLNDLTSIQKDLPGELCHIQIDVTGVCKKCKK